MGEQPTPRIEVLRPEVEILPPDHSEPGPSYGRSRVWITADAQGGAYRVHVVKPGPIATLLLFLALGVLLVVSFFTALALFVVFVGVSGLAAAGLLVYGLIRGATSRLR
jgi:hypothetical protein